MGNLRRGGYSSLYSPRMMLRKMHNSSFLILVILSYISTTPSSALPTASTPTGISGLDPNEPIKIKLLTPSSVPKKHTRTRQNSRFLRTFPASELMSLARRSEQNYENEVFEQFQEDHHAYPSPYSPYKMNPYPHPLGSMKPTWPMKSHRNAEAAGNSPIFYIKLPPVPYVFMPGVGYVSPHPYNGGGSSQNSGMSNMPLGAMMMSMGSSMNQGGGSSSSLMPLADPNDSRNVISLPLKFLSNGRPHQIESPKKRRKPGPGMIGIKQDSPPKNMNNKNKDKNKFPSMGGMGGGMASLISGGKYSFNGRPTAVFVVRSPLDK